MKRFLRSEAGAAVLWVICSVLLGAALTPWVYRAGMALGHAHGLPAPLAWLGAAAVRARFGRFFSRSLMACAIGLLPLLYLRIRRLRWSGAPAAEGLARGGWKSALGQMAAGFAIAAALLGGMGFAAHALGAFAAKPSPPELARLLGKAAVPAIFASLFEEWLFRGVLLGLWLRFSRPAAACVGTAVFFATVHFLTPPPGSHVADPAALGAGFELVGKIVMHFANPRFFVTEFATLFLIGLILAWTRVRTDALWLAIGLHAGWVFAFKGFNLIYKQVPASPLHPWIIGNSLKSGLLPLATLLVTAAVCHFVMQRLRAGRRW